MTRYCFEVELLEVTAQDVQNSLPNIPYQVTGFTSARGTSVILIVESDEDENTVYDAIARVLPMGTRLYRTTTAYTPVRHHPMADVAQKLRDKNFPPVALDNPKSKL